MRWKGIFLNLLTVHLSTARCYSHYRSLSPLIGDSQRLPCATLRALTFPSVRSPRASQEIFAFSASFLKLEIAALTGLPSGVLYPPHGVEAALSAFGDGVKAFWRSLCSASVGVGWGSRILIGSVSESGVRSGVTLEGVGTSTWISGLVSSKDGV